MYVGENGARRGDRLEGLGTLHHGSERLGTIRYIVHLSPTTGQARVVEFAEQPKARDGQLLHLELADGRVVNCQMLGQTTYCAVIGEGPIQERRRAIRMSSSPNAWKPR
jgi:hypothetical protein